MALSHVSLEPLCGQAGSGCELTPWFDHSIGHFRGAVTQRSRDLAVEVRGATFGDVYAVAAQAATQLPTCHDDEKRQFPDPSTLSGAALHRYLMQRAGIRAEHSSIEWLDEVPAATP